MDPLADPRVRLIVNDARGALMLTQERYDAIVSQPSHPWTSGSSHLYTREFFALAREHLQPGGVLLQWMGLRFIDEALLRSLIATLVEVFPHVQIYRPVQPGILFLASDRPFDSLASAETALEAAPRAMAKLGVFGLEEVAAALVLDEAGARAVARGSEWNTDDRNHLLMDSPGISRGRRGFLDPDPAFAPYDPLLQPTAGLDRPLIVRRLLARGFPKRARRVAEATENPVARATGLGLVELSAGNTRPAERLLEHALELDPGRETARMALLRLRRRALVRGELEALALAGPLEGAAAATAEGWRLQAEKDWSGLRSLEARLAEASPRHPAYPDATRLRTRWRLANGTPALAREAVDLLDALISLGSRADDLRLRARAAAQAGDWGATVASLFELASRPSASLKAPLLRDALALVGALPEQVVSAEDRSQLESRLRRGLR